MTETPWTVVALVSVDMVVVLRFKQCELNVGLMLCRKVATFGIEKKSILIY